MTTPVTGALRQSAREERPTDSMSSASPGAFVAAPSADAARDGRLHPDPDAGRYRHSAVTDIGSLTAGHVDPVAREVRGDGSHAKSAIRIAAAAAKMRCGCSSGATAVFVTCDGLDDVTRDASAAVTRDGARQCRSRSVGAVTRDGDRPTMSRSASMSRVTSRPDRSGGLTMNLYSDSASDDPSTREVGIEISLERRRRTNGARRLIQRSGASIQMLHSGGAQ
jgi:hypothetical protein